MTHPTPEPTDLEIVLNAARDWAHKITQESVDTLAGMRESDAIAAAIDRLEAMRCSREGHAEPAPNRVTDLTATVAGVLFRPGHRVAIVNAETDEVLTWRRLGDATIGPMTAGVARIEPALECRAEFTGYAQVAILDEAGETLARGPRYIVGSPDIVTVDSIALEVLTQ